MERFRVECLSCHGKLIIRTADFLGQIVACPRCKSMVQIPATPPLDDFTSSPSKPATLGILDNKQTIVPTGLDSGAITRVDDGRLAEVAAQHEIVTHGGIQPPAVPEHVDWKGESVDTAIDRNGTPTALDLDKSKNTDSGSAEKSLGRNNRQWIKVLIAGLATSGLALVGFFLFLQFVKPNDANLPENKNLNQKQIAQNPALAIPVEKSPHEADAGPPTIPEKQNDPKEADLNATNEVVQGTANGNAESPEITSTIPGEMEKPLVPKTPIGLDLNNKEAMEIETKVASDNANPQDDEMPPFMRELEAFFDPGSATLQPDASTTENPDAIFDNQSQVDIATLYHPNPIEPPVWDDVQNLVIPKMVAKDKRLSSMLIMLGQLGGIGIGWDYETVRLSGFDINQLVSLDVEQQKLGDVLADLIKPLDLSALSLPTGQILLSPPLELVAKKLPEQWDISDLIQQETDLQKWKDTFALLFPWLRESLQFEQSLIVWGNDVSVLDKAYVAIFLDQARSAIGKPVTSAFDQEFILPVKTLMNSLEYLNKKGTRILKESVATVQILDTAADETGMDLAIDWQSCNSHGLSHAASGTSLTRGRTWSQIAGKYLDQFALVAVVDGTHRLVLTTLPSQRRMWRTAVVSLEANDTIEKVRESLRPLSPTDANGRSVLLVKELPLTFKDDKRLAVIRIAPPNVEQMRQILVQDFIEKHGEPDKQ